MSPRTVTHAQCGTRCAANQVLVSDSSLVSCLVMFELSERRAATPSPLPAAVEDRIQRLEDEYGALRQDVAEIQERQDFTERALLRESDVSRGEVPTPR